MKPTILCVDDESSNLDSLERCLRRDFNILLATSGKDALKLVESQSVQLIISDQQMPEMNGVEFLTRALTIQPEAVRILLTGFANLESVIEAINKGQVYRYMTKPWDPKDLVNTVEQALDVYQLRKRIQLQNQQLQEANTQLKSLDTMKNDFMLLVNHELRTPLTAITSYTQLLSEENLEDEHKLFLNKITKNTNRLQSLIEDTLLLTKLQSNSETTKLCSIDIKSVFEGLWNAIAGEFPKKSLSLNMQNPKAFKQPSNEKFVNILMGKVIHNAFQHSPDKASVDIEFSESPTRWSFKTRNPIAKPIEKPPEVLLNAFSTSENILNHAGGTGLGLAVIQAVAQLFRADVELSYDDSLFQLELHFPKP